MADRVFEDRVGLWVITPANLPARLPAIAAYGGGIIRDLFLPRTASLADLALVRAAGLYAHLWAADDDLGAIAYADRTLADVARLKPGAVDLNPELSADAPLPAYVRTTVERIRAKRPKLRIRLNLATWKAFAFPADLLASDPNLYAAESCYLGNMDARVSEADVLADMLANHVPQAKATVCYGAAGTPPGGGDRVCWLPELGRLRRGVIFSDDLMAEVGLL